MTTNIHITKIEQPDTGAVIALRCDKCKAVTYLWSPYAKKPEDGDYFLIKMCERIEHMIELPRVEYKFDPAGHTW